MSMWNNENPVRDTFDVPVWVDQDITWYDIAGITHKGCDSGAYLTATTYHKAAAIMAKHGDEVLDFLQEYYETLPTIPDDTSWGQIATLFLSRAVELWAATAADYYVEELEDAQS